MMTLQGAARSAAAVLTILTLTSCASEPSDAPSSSSPAVSTPATAPSPSAGATGNSGGAVQLTSSLPPVDRDVLRIALTESIMGFYTGAAADGKAVNVTVAWDNGDGTSFNSVSVTNPDGTSVAETAQNGADLAPTYACDPTTCFSSPDGGATWAPAGANEPFTPDAFAAEVDALIGEMEAGNGTGGVTGRVTYHTANTAFEILSRGGSNTDQLLSIEFTGKGFRMVKLDSDGHVIATTATLGSPVALPVDLP